MEATENDDIAKLQAALKCAENLVPEKPPRERNPELEVLLEAQAAGEAAIAAVDRLLQQTIATLNECRQHRTLLKQKLKDKTTATKTMYQNPTVTKRFIRWPYFRDANNFQPPDNNDTKTRKNVQLPDLMRLTPVHSWNNQHKHCLQRSITKQARKRAVDAAISQIKALQRRNANTEEMQAAELKLKQAKSEMTPIGQLVEPLSTPDTYDWEIIADDCPGRSGFECRAMWRMFLHPQINKGPWTSAEVSQFKQLIERLGTQHWDQIAEDLATNRTAYQCFVYYKMHICRNQTAGVKWTTEEDLYLFSVVENCRIGDYIPWAKVAFCVENRSKTQIYNRWIHVYKNFKRGKFSPEEVAVLEAAVPLFGKDFKKISNYLPGRSDTIVANHFYTQCQRKSLIDWSLEEDTLLVALTTTKPFNFSEIRRKFPKKSIFNIHRRYIFLTKWQKRNSNTSLSHVIRNKNTPMSKTVALAKFNKALKALYGTLHSTPLSFPEKPLSRSKVDVVDRRLIRYFQQLNSKQIEPPKETTNSNVGKTNPDRLKPVLFLLGAKLNRDLISAYRNSNKTTKVLDDLLQSKPATAEPIKPSGIRTYSRKNNNKPESAVAKMVSTAKINIWQHESKDSSIQSHFPPSFQTISAIRTMSLLKYFQSHNIAKRCASEGFTDKHNESINLWITRFEALFKWPLLLSNIVPNTQLTMFLEDKNSQLKSKSEQKECDNDLPDADITVDFTGDADKPYISCSARKRKTNKRRKIEPIVQEIDFVTPSHFTKV